MSPRFVLTIPSIVETFNVGISAVTEKQFVTETPAIRNNIHGTTIGFSAKAKIESAVEDRPPFEVPVTITGICISPSSSMMTVGGEWQATDNVALIIGYSVLNAYWIAPTAVGIGLGIYLVKRRF